MIEMLSISHEVLLYLYCLRRRNCLLISKRLLFVVPLYSFILLYCVFDVDVDSSQYFEIMAAQSQGKNWCFTWNNYSADDEEYLKALPGVSYMVYGREIGDDEATPHLQGFVRFEGRKRFNVVRDIMKQNHIELARNVPASILYCKKDGDYYENGDATIKGARCDLEAFKTDAKTGTMSIRQLREAHSEVFAKYPRFCHDYIRDNLPEIPIPEFPFRPWQEGLSDRLKGEPDNRKIIFVVDYVGNSGKSWFARFFLAKNARVQILQPGKLADMVYALDQTIRVLFLDCPRSKQGDFIQYEFLEHLKDGLLFCGKYESSMKQLGPCHVVCLMNEQPDMTKLSEDRYDIINL